MFGLRDCEEHLVRKPMDSREGGNPYGLSEHECARRRFTDPAPDCRTGIRSRHGGSVTVRHGDAYERLLILLMKTADLHLLSASCHDEAQFMVPGQVVRTGMDSGPSTRGFTSRARC